MRVFLFVAVVLVLMGLLGWIQFHRTSDHATITVETKMIEKDLRKTAEVVHDKAAEKLQEFKAPDEGSKVPPQPE